ncbi:MAG: NAD(+) diphosphatase, partial [Dehalococcoidia bacterium]|nr:NAD(+) diphosphatase [Dehalococcoidia bacterium]
MQDIIPFAGSPLDRVANQRRDPDWLEEQLRLQDTRLLPFWRLNVLVRDGSPPELAWLPVTSVDVAPSPQHLVLLGTRDGRAHFAVDVSASVEPPVPAGLDGARFAEVRSIAALLAVGEAGIVAQGRSLLDWHARHGFCPACGERTELREAGYMRKCSSCSAEHFPRTDPVVIMVVWREDRCLLGRQKAWAPGSYSALAGFMEPGETIEEAVKREVSEEVGLEVDQVSYHASQPWPYPSSLMIGCFAHATGEEIDVDSFELDGARWFSRDEVRQAVYDPSPALGFSVPGR